MVFPIVGRIDKKPESFNDSEVQEVYFVSIDELKNEKKWIYRGLYDTDWIFNIDNEILWGATAKMVRRLLRIS